MPPSRIWADAEESVKQQANSSRRRQERINGSASLRVPLGPSYDMNVCRGIGIFRIPELYLTTRACRVPAPPHAIFVATRGQRPRRTFGSAQARLPTVSSTETACG